MRRTTPGSISRVAVLVAIALIALTTSLGPSTQHIVQAGPSANCKTDVQDLLDWTAMTPLGSHTVLMTITTIYNDAKSDYDYATGPIQKVNGIFSAVSPLPSYHGSGYGLVVGTVPGVQTTHEIYINPLTIGRTYLQFGITQYGVHLDIATVYNAAAPPFPWFAIINTTPLNVTCMNGVMYGFINANALTAASFKKVIAN